MPFWKHHHKFSISQIIRLVKSFLCNCLKCTFNLNATLNKENRLTVEEVNDNTNQPVTNEDDILDYIHLMTYDLNSSEISSHLTCLSDCINYTSVEETVIHYKNQGIPSEKLVIGAAFYGKTYYFVAIKGWIFRRGKKQHQNTSE